MLIFLLQCNTTLSCIQSALQKKCITEIDFVKYMFSQKCIRKTIMSTGPGPVYVSYRVGYIRNQHAAFMSEYEAKQPQTDEMMLCRQLLPIFITKSQAEPHNVL